MDLSCGPIILGRGFDPLPEDQEHRGPGGDPDLKNIIMYGTDQDYNTKTIRKPRTDSHTGGVMLSVSYCLHDLYYRVHDYQM